MLKGIPSIISPDLLRVLDEMGHDDEIVLADGNFPGASTAKCGANGKEAIFLRADGLGVCELLTAILKVFPLDTYSQSVYIMDKVEGEDVKTPIWNKFEEIIAPHTTDKPQKIERFAFYERSKKAYCIVQTGESEQYANIILKKGVVIE
jgi:L-fucose mutarotase